MLLCALAADPVHFHVVAMDAETCGRTFLQADRSDIFGRHVHYRLAAQANHVMMRRRVRFESRRTVMGADLADQPMLFECLQVLVYGREGNRWNVSPNKIINRLRARMSVHSREGLEDNLSLVRYG